MSDNQPSNIETIYCATHPQVETVLRCGKCSKPICPRCLVHTPVGARCRDCAQLRRLPIFTVSPRGYAIAIGAGLAIALGVGVVWGIFVSFFGGFLSILVAAGAGYTIGELIGTAANHKRSRGLQIVAGVSTFLGYIVSQLTAILAGPALGRLPALQISGELLGSLALRSALGVLLNPFALLAVALAIFLAVSRFR